MNARALGETIVSRSPAATADRTAIRAGLQRAVDMAGQLVDPSDCERLVAQLTGVTRAAQRLGNTLSGTAHDRR
jgi:hypothetical protein